MSIAHYLMGLKLSSMGYIQLLLILICMHAVANFYFFLSHIWNYCSLHGKLLVCLNLFYRFLSLQGEILLQRVNCSTSSMLNHLFVFGDIWLCCVGMYICATLAWCKVCGNLCSCRGVWWIDTYLLTVDCVLLWYVGFQRIPQGWSLQPITASLIEALILFK